jgi:hypothetical protein
MQYLKITNKGLIELAALKLVGASTKDGQSSIGQFGSGNKYALAYLLRNNYKVRIFSGKEEIKITLEPVILRDETYMVICFNGETTSITTNMGKQWECWQAVREIYSNAKDEGEESFGLTSKVAPKDNQTHFYIEVKAELLSIVENFDNYFANSDKVLAVIPGYGRILKKSNPDKVNLFRKGIKCYVTNKENSLYDYDFENVTVGEDRLISYPWVIKDRIAELLTKCENRKIIKVYLNSINNPALIESTTKDAYFGDFSTMFVAEMQDNVFYPAEQAGYAPDEDRVKAISVPQSLLSKAKAFLSKRNILPTFQSLLGTSETLFEEVTLNALQQEVMNKVEHFCQEVNFDYKYPIVYVNFFDKEILGMAHDGKILLSTNSINAGAVVVMGTIIEEYAHLESKFSDCTRGFQTFLINMLVNYMQKSNSYLL